MKPYGLKVEEGPDVADIQHMAAKSSVGQIKRKSGDFRSTIRSARAKQATRRYWKRKARAQGKIEALQELRSYSH